MISYPHPELLDLLHIDHSPAEYHELHQDTHILNLLYSSKDYIRYWAEIPRYKYAICPICGLPYEEPADTYTLKGWTTYLHWIYTLYPLPKKFPSAPWCPHFLGLQRFANLHGNAPTELEFFINTAGEVPYISDWYFSADIPTYTVLHALPICRVEGTRFTPRYTTFILSYFSADKRTVLARRKELDAENLAEEYEYYQTPAFYTPEPPTPANAARYDLAAWAARGQLGWLDYTDPALPLRIGPGAALPTLYRTVVGNRTGYTWEREP
ncbi:MAG: hypothetical protein M3Z04_00150 [Chloroflexota bacterium]|nr:hypothetical protein [Chloroflexota bacterium]